MRQQAVVWKATEYEGLEYLLLRADGDGLTVKSAFIAAPAEGAYRVDYEIQCDPNYAVREIQVSIANGVVLHLSSDGYGNWFDENRQLVAALKGCIDIDISGTPFTNTLPIRRITWQPGQSETFTMTYFSIPEMTIHADQQRYTCVEQRADGALFRFEQVATGFTALLPVDVDGLVLDYPGLFQRVWSG